MLSRYNAGDENKPQFGDIATQLCGHSRLPCTVSRSARLFADSSHVGKLGSDSGIPSHGGELRLRHLLTNFKTDPSLPRPSQGTLLRAGLPAPLILLPSRGSTEGGGPGASSTVSPVH